MGLIAANLHYLTELLVSRFLEPLPEPFRKVANREGKVVPLSEEMVTLLDALKEAKILVEKAEVKKKEISVTYLKEEVLE